MLQSERNKEQIARSESAVVTYPVPTTKPPSDELENDNHRGLRLDSLKSTSSVTRCSNDAFVNQTGRRSTNRVMIHDALLQMVDMRRDCWINNS